MPFYVFVGTELKNHVSFFFLVFSVFNVLKILLYPTEIVLLVLCIFSYCSYN